MVNPTILLPILNASLSANLGCWEQNPPSKTQLIPVIFKECSEAITNIPMGEKALAPVMFGRSTDAGFQVPESWTYGHCTIEIDVIAEYVDEITTFAAIFKRAFDLTKDCVIHPPHLGGRSLLGNNGLLKVWIYGVGSTAEDYHKKADQTLQAAKDTFSPMSPPKMLRTSNSKHQGGTD